MNASVTPLRVTDPEPSNALRQPPHNYEAERALLGAMLMNNRSHERVSDFLLPEHFADPVNGRIYAVCCELLEGGKPATPVTLKTYLERDDLVLAAGGMSYLGTIAASAVTIINAKEYGQLIFDLYLRRELIVIGENLVNEAYDAQPNEPAQVQVEAIEERLFGLVAAPDRGGLVAFEKALNEAVDIAEAAHQRRGALIGVTTGLRDLDTKLAGLHPTDLIILAGRPSMGKTALATKIAVSAARYYKTTDHEEDRDKQVAFFSLEMSRAQLSTRIIAESANLDSHRIRAGQLTDEEFTAFVVKSTELRDLPLRIDDQAAATVGAIRTRCRRLARTKKLGLVVIDYLQLISPGGREKPENRVQELSLITRSLKALAKDLNVPVLALSQLSRAVEQREEKRPQLSDLRESGTIEQDSDVVMFVYREEYYLERAEPSDSHTDKWQAWRDKLDACANIAEVIVGKQRHGPIGIVRTRFEPTRTAFSDLEERHGLDFAARTAASASAPKDDFELSEPPPGHPAAEKGLFDVP